ncbi:MAG: DUF3108 domain-containing protein [Candidatus Omnitrophica bacterium]|nr:DUF3108 domain-containing protein [Candidatus Omnitrophota bacterium]
MRTALLTFQLFAYVTLTGCASTGLVRGTEPGLETHCETSGKPVSRHVELPAGKRFEFDVAWNRIPVGKVSAEVRPATVYRGREVHEVTVKTGSNRFLSAIYRVEDVYTSYVDAETFTSRRYEADRREGNYRKHVVVEYDLRNNRAVYTNYTDGSVKTCYVEKQVQDPVSAMAYFMTMPVDEEKTVRITVNLNEKNYDLTGTIGKREIVDLQGLGVYTGRRIRPSVTLGGRKVRKGRAWMYFSDDKNRYPLYGVVRIPFGSVTATLRKIEDL